MLLARAEELVEGRLYYLVNYADAETMTTPVVVSLVYSGTQDEDGLYVFFPLPRANSQVLLEPSALGRILDLQGLREELARNAS